MQVVSHDVIEHLSQTRVISSATNRNHPDSPAEVLGRRAGAFAQFRHVTTGTKQVLAEPAAVNGNFWVSTAGEAPSIHERSRSTCHLTSPWTLVIIRARLLRIRYLAVPQWVTPTLRPPAIDVLLIQIQPGAREG